MHIFIGTGAMTLPSYNTQIHILQTKYRNDVCVCVLVVVCMHTHTYILMIVFVIIKTKDAESYKQDDKGLRYLAPCCTEENLSFTA